MTSLQAALEIPDDEPRQWRGAPLALGLGVIIVVAATLLARTFALGGTTRPWLAVGAVTGLPPLVIAWLAAGPHAHRTLLAATAMVIGLCAIPIASSGATPSVARLTQIVDGLRLPGAIERNTTLGDGRCREACSELRRVSLVEGISYLKVRAQIIATLFAEGWDPREYPHAQDAPVRIDAAKGKVLAQFELRFIDLGKTRVASVFIADGPEPAHQVG